MLPQGMQFFDKYITSSTVDVIFDNFWRHNSVNRDDALLKLSRFPSLHEFYILVKFRDGWCSRTCYLHPYLPNSRKASHPPTIKTLLFIRNYRGYNLCKFDGRKISTVAKISFCILEKNTYETFPRILINDVLLYGCFVAWKRSSNSS